MLVKNLSYTKTIYMLPIHLAMLKYIKLHKELK
jgi:hypothetical protein